MPESSAGFGYLARAQRLLEAVRDARPPLLEDSADLRREAERIRPVLEEVAGRPYGRLPRVSYRRRLEARVAGPWSQYLTLGLGFTRVVRMCRAADSRPAIPTVLAHELAHRYAFDESVTTLRGLEASARMARAGDAAHSVAARLELARLLLGAALVEGLERPAMAEALDAFFAERATRPGFGRTAVRWQRMRLRGRPDWAAAVYAALPVAALESAAAAGRALCEPPPFPRFPLDGIHALTCATYTGVDALTGRRRVRVPVEASLELWKSA